MPLYFAYGSNLDAEQMRERCPGSSLISTGVLKGYRIDFTRYSRGFNGGVADVLADPAQDVWGKVWELTNEHFESLDGYEGYPIVYTRFQSVIMGPREKFTDVWVYTVVNKKSFVAPSEFYLNIIKQAAIDYGFPESYRSMLNTITTQ